MKKVEKEKETPKNQEPEKVVEETPEVPEDKTKENKEDLEKNFKSVEAQKEHWREKAEKAEAELEKFKPKEEPKNEESVSMEEKVKVMEFQLSNPDEKYSEEEVSHISFIAKEKSVSLKEAADLAKGYIEFNRQKVADEKKIPEPATVPTEKKEATPESVASDKEAHKALWLKNMEEGTTQKTGI